MDIIEQLEGTEFDGCITKQENSTYCLRWNYESTDFRGEFVEYCEVMDLLTDRGLTLKNVISEHDCLTGDVYEIEWLALRAECQQIENEKKLDKQKEEL